MARRYQTGSIDAFDLLAQVGRDCVGALQILPDDMVPGDNGDVQASQLSEAEVAQVLRASTTPSVMGLAQIADDFRISIAGAQEKTALLWLNGRWCITHGATATTHIFKLPLGLIGGLKLDMRC